RSSYGSKIQRGTKKHREKTNGSRTTSCLCKSSGCTSESKAWLIMDPEIIKKIFARFQKTNPNPKTELQFGSPFELLVAVILSAQATDVGVNKATQKLFH